MKGKNNGQSYATGNTLKMGMGLRKCDVGECRWVMVLCEGGARVIKGSTFANASEGAYTAVACSSNREWLRWSWSHDEWFRRLNPERERLQKGEV